YLDPDSRMLPVPDGVDPVLATLFNPLGAGIRWAWQLPDTQPGAVVAILGPGIRGLCSVIAAKEAGASFIAVTGRGRHDASRLEWARVLGADVTIDVEQED